MSCQNPPSIISLVCFFFAFCFVFWNWLFYKYWQKAEQSIHLHFVMGPFRAENYVFLPTCIAIQKYKSDMSLVFDALALWYYSRFFVALLGNSFPLFCLGIDLFVVGPLLLLGQPSTSLDKLALENVFSQTNTRTKNHCPQSRLNLLLAITWPLGGDVLFFYWSQHISLQEAVVDFGKSSQKVKQNSL